MRILDRLAGPNPPKIVVIDPRETLTSKQATVHLQLKVGTNVAVMNGLLNLIIQAGYIDNDYINAHTVGFEQLQQTVSQWTPERFITTLFEEPRNGNLGLLRDLHDLWLLANGVQLSWIVLERAAIALRDDELLGTCSSCGGETKRQLSWLMTRIKQAASQTLVVAE